MLKNIILFLTESYGNTISDSAELVFFMKEMKKRGVSVKFGRRTENRIEEILEKEGTLYISDDAAVLSDLQKNGCYTVALYHEGVDSLLTGTKYAIEDLAQTEWEYLYKIYQRFTGQPWEITQTERCMIREMCEKDLEDLYKLYESPGVTRFMEGLFSEKEQERRYINDYIKNVYEYYGFGTWLIHLKEDGQLIGRAGFNYRAGFKEAELGFVIGEPYWRKGYAYEVCSHLLKLGKNVYGFDAIQALVKPENKASIHLLKKLGFVYRETVFETGEWYQRYLT